MSSVLVQVIALLFKSIFHACIRFFQESCAIYCAWLALTSALEIQFSDCTGRQQSCITQTVRIFLARISHSPGGEINCIPVSLEKMRNRRFFRRIQVALLFLSKGEKRFLTKYFPFIPYIFRDFLIGIEGRWPLKRRYNTPQKSSKEFSPFLGFHSFSRHNQVKGRAP